jgi:sigma-B regulation protein RsbU (phosphoserine phosphatase)
LNFWSTIRGRLAPLAQTRLARFTAYLGGVELVLILLRAILAVAGAASVAGPLGGWIKFLGLVLVVLVIALALRWFRDHVMWSVRNRLIVTYLFIGGVPIVLVLLMASLSLYFLAEQFAAYIALTEIDAHSQRLQEANASTVGTWTKRAVPSRTDVKELPAGTEDKIFPGRTVSMMSESERPAWLKDGFHGLVIDQNRLFLRAVNIAASGNKRVAIVSSVPVDKKLLSAIAANLGPITFFVPPGKQGGNNDMQIHFGQGTVDINGKPATGVSSGVLPPEQNRWDKEFSYYTVIQPPNWRTGADTDEVLMMGTMRASSLYSRLAAPASKWANVIFILLGVLAVLFGLMVVVAWLIGFRLTRTLTYSVANLYRATEHINRGDFTHRIDVRHKDQLGALQTAFNSMTDSLEKLIEEQKEKERLQSELEIAHEVQSQLFPQFASGTRTLEVYGTCRPARIVSGDYYDFLSYGPSQVGIAVGDISGKGISAALLMASIHSAIRAYQQEHSLEAGVASAYGTGSALLTATTSRIVCPSPAETLWLLNRHVYQSTAPEKYATLFLGFYDDESRRLTYSNAGHLPPIILARDGSTRRLDVGGTVVGLFDYVEYEKQTVELYPGDLFIAFSDGMTEPENEFGEFGEERLVETISTYRDLPLDRICEHAVAAVQDWIGSNEQPDDVTLVLARRAV